MLNLRKYKPESNMYGGDFRDELFKKRLETIDIAIHWPGDGTPGKFVFNNIWTYTKDPSYVVSLGKYGKEFYEKDKTGTGIKNKNDMRPSIIYNGTVIEEIRGGFNDIFNLLETLKGKNKKNVLSAFAVIFLRNALLLDHKIIDGKYCYNPNAKLVRYICRRCPEHEGVPMEVYIHFLDAIALNEDVKYWTKGKLDKSKGAGRENNMKTYVYFICCLLNKEPWSEFIYKFMHGGGVAAISNNAMAKNFPFLGLQCRERKQPSGKISTQTITITKVENQEPEI